MRRVQLHVLFCLAGCTALAFPVLWVRELVFVLGESAQAVTTAVAAVMGGLGLGAFVAGRWGDRWGNPGRMVGFLTNGIGLLALCVPVLLTVAEAIHDGMYGAGSAAPLLKGLAQLVGAAVVVFVPCMLIGALLPLAFRAASPTGAAIGRTTGLLHGLFLLGAASGVLIVGTVLLSSAGLTAVGRWLAVFNIVVGILAVNLLAKPLNDSDEAKASGKGLRGMSDGERQILMIGYALSGLLAVTLCIAWTRAMILESIPKPIDSIGIHDIMARHDETHGRAS